MAGRPRAAGASSRRSSTKLFHSPQSGQRPSHFELSSPQAWQAKRTRTLLMAAGSPDRRSGEVREAAEAAPGLGEGLAPRGGELLEGPGRPRAHPELPDDLDHRLTSSTGAGGSRSA